MDEHPSFTGPTLEKRNVALMWRCWVEKAVRKVSYLHLFKMVVKALIATLIGHGGQKLRTRIEVKLKKIAELQMNYSFWRGKS